MAAAASQIDYSMPRRWSPFQAAEDAARGTWQALAGAEGPLQAARSGGLS
jgi:predicted lipoprotein with Yx(FWY)xxD motif